MEKYLRTRGVREPWGISGTVRHDFRGAVVIPALAESAALPRTLDALAANPQPWLERILVLVVVNNRPNAPEALRRDNRRTLEMLRAARDLWPQVSLGWVDAASPGQELPEQEGVGLARKIGLDLALERLDWAGRPVLVSLDADTLVQQNYLQAVVEHFHWSAAGAAVLPFAHQTAQTPAAQEAITLYELYLRHYVLGLTLAGSPYAYHSIGSALACRACAYAAVGGMNRRHAGEDFYFLQQLAKTVGVTQLRGTLVQPSPRVSARTPFGTGPSVAALQAGAATTVRFYALPAFEILKSWLDVVQGGVQDAEALLAGAARLGPPLEDFLRRRGFASVWNNLCRQHGGHQGRLLAAFHQWFDGLKTRQLLGELCDKQGLWGDPWDLLPPLLSRAGLKSDGDLGAYLAVLRQQQNFPVR
ncbi:glycosyltransferase [Geoalkalibacter halelectricus]|uniref:Glycosyltransferase n=1 Tax=Geoalkalibacter halelectricus TaxID=2847045 RepID=A0ABY5ZLY2_9BACT|nr:glycosyltransferase [Geoalkalibacter halelectricus]MDO3378540.1 glycosyltransferase [Geoalkalibacter halelectricus]UWZ80146.1 glycosyltransferase [Geoalkalibacter halelectricus]